MQTVSVGEPVQRQCPVTAPITGNAKDILSGSFLNSSVREATPPVSFVRMKQNKANTMLNEGQVKSP